MSEFFCQIGDFHSLAIWLLFLSVMSLFYGGLSKEFPRCLSNMYTRLMVILGSSEESLAQANLSTGTSTAS